jgi:hypothetical protein
MARIDGKPVRCYDLMDFKCAAAGHRAPSPIWTLNQARMTAARCRAKCEHLKGQLKHYERFAELVTELRVLLPKLG